MAVPRGRQPSAWRAGGGALGREEPPGEEDEPDDYMRDYYDEDQDPVDGDGDEQVL